MYESESEENNKKDLSLNRIFDEKFLKENFSFEKLNILNMFWQNRMAKEMQKMWHGIFAIDTVNLWDDILRKKEVPRLRKEALKNIICKEKILQEISKYMFKNIREKYDKQQQEKESDDKSYIKININSDLESMYKKYGGNYKTRFQEQLYESKNDFLDDFSMVYRSVNILENIYIIKDKILSSQLYLLVKKGSIRNFGVIKEEKKQDGKILIGIDAEGFNMPLRLHMNKQDIIDYFKSGGVSPIIPIYEGAEDFKYKDGRNIPTFLLLPLSRNQKNFLNKTDNTQDTPYDNYRSHLRFLANNDKFPPHLKNSYGKRERKYLNLETGEEATTNKEKGEKNAK